MQSSDWVTEIAETIHEDIFNARIDEAIKELNQNKDDET